MLILQGMCQLVSHDRPLTIDINPIGQMELLHFGIVVARDLLAQKSNHESPVLKVCRCQTQLLQANLSGMCFVHSHGGVEIFHDHPLDLRARLG